MEEIKLTNKQLKSIVKEVKQFFKDEEKKNNDKQEQKVKQREMKQREKLLNTYKDYKENHYSDLCMKLLYEMMELEYEFINGLEKNVVNFEEDIDDESLLGLSYLTDNDTFEKVLDIKNKLKFK